MAELSPWERLQIVTDFCGYNAYSGTLGSHDHGAGYYWVGDLTLNCQVHVEDAGEGELLLELNEGPRRYRCRFDLATGEATLFYPDAQSRDETEIVTLGTAQTSVNGPGTYELSFANVDNRLCLWVNDELIDFGTDDKGRPNAEYPPFGGIGIRQAPNDRDLIPVGIAAKGATVEVSHLKIQRDIYYRAEYISYNPEIAMNHAANTRARATTSTKARRACFWIWSRTRPGGMRSIPTTASRPSALNAWDRASFSCSATTAPAAKTADCGRPTAPALAAGLAGRPAPMPCPAMLSSARRFTSTGRTANRS